MSTVTEADLKELSSQIANGFREVNTQLVNISDRLTKVETKVDSIDSRLTKVETKVDRLETKVDSLETKVDDIDRRLIKEEIKIESIETNVRDISGTYKNQMWALIALLTTALLSAMTVGIVIPLLKVMILGDRTV